MNKKSFVLYQEYKHNISTLSQNQKGDLLDAIFAYNNGEVIDLDPLTSMAFSFIRSDLERNGESWRKTQEERSLNGRIGNLKRWNPDLYKQFKAGKITLEEAENIVKDRKVSHSDNSESLKSLNGNGNVNGNVNVNVNVNDKEDKKTKAKKAQEECHRVIIMLEKRKAAERLKEKGNFNDFWKNYTPIKCNDKFIQKGSKEEVRKTYNKAITKDKHENIMLGLKKYLTHCKKNNQLTCGAAVFLNQKKWLDEYDCVEADKKTTTSKATQSLRNSAQAARNVINRHKERENGRTT